LGWTVQKTGNGSTLRKLAFLVIFSLVLFCACAVTPASASVTYILTLSANGGSYSGSGTLTASPFPPTTGSGSKFYDVGGTGGDGTLSLNITLSNGSGTTFTFSTASSGNSGLGSACSAQLNYPTPSLNSISCDLASNSGGAGTSGGATLDIYDNSGGAVLVGTGSTYNGLSMTSALAPEPSTLLLWGTGLLALGAIFRKKVGVGSAV
jgi:hypothetical protein